MGFPESLDFDKLAFQVYGRTAKAVQGWIDGTLTTEEPLINRITENFKRMPRKCDVGNTHPVAVRADWAILHRQGDARRDKFGSDIAVTIYIEELNLIKTVLFQTKVSEDYHLRLQKDQLDEALAIPQTKGRAFILAVDKRRQGIRIESASKLVGEFSDEKSQGFNAANWMMLGEWMYKWFSCDIGEPSDAKDPASVEKLLESFVRESNRDEDQGRPWGRIAGEDSEADESAIPAKAWLSFLFVDPQSRWLK